MPATTSLKVSHPFQLWYVPALVYKISYRFLNILPTTCKPPPSQFTKPQTSQLGFFIRTKDIKMSRSSQTAMMMMTKSPSSSPSRSPGPLLARMLSRLRRLEIAGRISTEEKKWIKDRLLELRTEEVVEENGTSEVVAAFSAWIDDDESDEALEVSLKALVSSFSDGETRQQRVSLTAKYVEEEEQDSEMEDHVLDGRTPTPEYARVLSPFSRNTIHNRTLLFYAQEMREVATKAQALSKDRLLLGNILWERFDTPDGWPHLFIEKSHDLQFNDVLFLASFHSPLVVFEQLSAIYALARYGCRSLRVIVPFFPTGTMERVERVGEVATAASLARMVSMVPQCSGGPAQFVFLDIHALQEQFYFTDQVIVLLKSCIRLLLKTLSRLPKNERVVIVFPDDGAFKRFNKKFAEFPTVICHKLRLQGDERVVEIRDGAEFVAGSHCVIVDDLVKSGGTLIECADVLLKGGASKVSAYVTHGVFPNDSFKKFFHSSKPKVMFDTFWVTDTIPTVACKLTEPPFKVLSIAPLLTFLRQNFWDTEPDRYD